MATFADVLGGNEYSMSTGLLRPCLPCVRQLRCFGQHVPSSFFAGSTYDPGSGAIREKPLEVPFSIRKLEDHASDVTGIDSCY